MRRSLWALLVVGVIAFVVIAWLRVPWHPVPGGPIHPPPARDYFTQTQLDRAEHYARWGRAWGYAGLAVSLLVASLFGFTRLGTALTSRLRGPWWLRVVEVVVALVAAGTLATLPFGLVLHHRQRAYGLSTQGVGSFLVDAVIGDLVTIVATSIALIAFMLCVRRLPRRWPIVSAAVLGVLVMGGSFVYPVLVEPLFNHFTPLPAGDLRSQILVLAQEEHVHLDDVLVADASRRTTTLNAYVSGYGGTRRVVLYDNLVREEPPDITLSVVAHELAHAHHDDVLTGTLLGLATAVASVGALGLLVGRRRTTLGDPVVVPLLLALVALGTFASDPVQNTISRHIETRADVDALRVYDGDAFIRLQQQLAIRSVGDPTPPPLAQFWFGTHPTTMQRIAIAERLGSHRVAN